MIQCTDCEHFHRDPDGKIVLACNPFNNIKEPECLLKWQLLRLSDVSVKLDRIVSAYESTTAMYKRLAPLQEKMFRHMERELEAADEADQWKSSESAWDDEDEDEDDEDADTGDTRPY